MRFLSSLGTTDQHGFILERLSQDKLACRWFLEHPKVKSWLSTQDLGAEVLYVTARAGCGKTTIIAHTIQYMKSVLLQNPFAGEAEEDALGAIPRPILLCFLFQKRSLDEEGTAVASMKAMIRQLLDQRPDYYPVFLRKYEILSTKGSVSWSLAHLWSIFLGILERLSEKTVVYMILDGLDECEGSSQRALLAKLQSLLNNLISQDAGSSACILRIMISGRPDEQLPEIITFAKQLEITPTDTSWDMGVFIDSQVSHFASRRSLDPKTAKDLCIFLNRRAEGMFLWVVLVMGELDRRDVRLSDEVIRAKIQKVPTTLYSQYEAILKSSPASRQSDLWRILRWLLNARRMLSLAELEAALCTELDISRWHDLRGDINFLCGSVIRFESDTVSFIHQSVRDFLYDYILESPRHSTGGICMSLHETEAQMATTCLKFLGNTHHLEELDSLQAQGHLLRNEDVDSYLNAFPFLAYAAEFWAAHLRTADSLVPHFQPMHSLVIQTFDSSLNRDLLMQLDYFLKHAMPLGVCRCGTRLHLAGYFKLPLLVSHYLSEGASTTEDAGAGSHPLVWTAETGSYECIEKLLKAGADPNQVEYDGWSPLHWAATNGHKQVCGLLIRYGARMDIEDSRGYSARDLAIQMGHHEIARKYFGGVKGGKPWVPSNYSPQISIIGNRRVAI
jgi:hypothetical protein